MRASFLVSLLAVLGPGVTPAATTADTRFIVNLSPDVRFCNESGRGVGTIILNSDRTQLSYDFELHCLSSNLWSPHWIHAPVLPGQSPESAPVILELVGTGSNSIDCPTNLCGPTLLCDHRGRAWGSSAVNPTVVSYLMNGVAWLAARTIECPDGGAWGPIVLDVTLTRPMTWGSLKIIYR